MHPHGTLVQTIITSFEFRRDNTGDCFLELGLELGTPDDVQRRRKRLTTLKAIAWTLVVLCFVTCLYSFTDIFDAKRKKRAISAPAPAQTSSPLASAASPTPSASAATVAPPGQATLCMPANADNLGKLFLQTAQDPSSPPKLLGKVAPYRKDRLGIKCDKPAPYDQETKTTDVSGCQICLPSEYAKPGKYKMGKQILHALFAQNDPTCYFEPTLPFRPNAETIKNGLRIDPECIGFDFDAVRQCYSVSACDVIVPAFVPQ